MIGWIARLFTLALVVALAVGTAGSTVEAAEGDYSKVPRGKLESRPFRGITLITIGDRVVCTGFVVGPRKVVTAAHCLVQNAAKGRYKFKPGLPQRVKVHRGYSQVQGGSRYRTCDVSKVWAHPKFVKAGPGDRQSGSRLHDFAVLTTDCVFPQSAFQRMWATEAGDGALTSGKRVRAAGYPVDPRIAGMNGLNLWRTEGRVRPVGYEPRHLRFTGFVSQGMSGGPVWRTYAGESPCGRTHCVVGIVTECAINGSGMCKQGFSDRLAIRITPGVKQLVQTK